VTQMDNHEILQRLDNDRHFRDIWCEFIRNLDIPGGLAAIDEINRRMAYGNKRHGWRDWITKPLKWFLEKIDRHMYKIQAGTLIDEKDEGLSHPSAIVANGLYAEVNRQMGRYDE